MGAAVEEREIFAADIEHDDFAALYRDELSATRRDLRGGGNDMPSHLKRFYAERESERLK
jgi:hypothetical protein